MHFFFLFFFKITRQIKYLRAETSGWNWIIYFNVSTCRKRTRTGAGFEERNMTCRKSIERDGKNSMTIIRYSTARSKIIIMRVPIQIKLAKNTLKNRIKNINLAAWQIDGRQLRNPKRTWILIRVKLTYTFVCCQRKSAALIIRFSFRVKHWIINISRDMTKKTLSKSHE